MWRKLAIGGGLTLAVLALTAVVIYSVWSNRAASDLVAVKAELRAEGMPVTLADINWQPPSPDPLGPHYRRAMAGLEEFTPASNVLASTGNWPLTDHIADAHCWAFPEIEPRLDTWGEELPPVWADAGRIAGFDATDRGLERLAIKALLLERQEVIADLDAVAELLPDQLESLRADLGVDPTVLGPDGVVALDHLTPMRELVATEGYVIDQLILSGRYDEAFDRTSRIFSMSVIIHNDSHALVTGLTGLGAEGAQLRKIRFIAAYVEPGDIDPRKLTRLAKSILERRPANELMAQAVAGESAQCHDFLQTFFGGGVGGFEQPYVDQNTAVILRVTADVRQALSEATYPSYLDALSTPAVCPDNAGWSLALAAVLAPWVEHLDITIYRFEADRRLTATAVGIAAYQLDHGRLPGTLNDLVPACQPAVPVDPFTRGELIRYFPEAERPFLFSVGAGESRVMYLDRGPLGAWEPHERHAVHVPQQVDGANDDLIRR